MPTFHRFINKLNIIQTPTTRTLRFELGLKFAKVREKPCVSKHFLEGVMGNVKSKAGDVY